MRKLSLLTLLTAVACGGELGSVTEDEAAIADSNVAPASEAAVPGSPIAELYDSDPKIEVRINNNAAGLTQELLPAISAELGMSEIPIADRTLVQGPAPSGLAHALTACHTNDWKLNLEDALVRAQLDSNDVSVVFDPDKALLTDFDKSDFDLDFTLEFSWPVNVDSWWCRTFGTNYDIEVTVDVDGIDGELDVTLEKSALVEIASIDDFWVNVDNVAFDSGFLTAITNIGLTVANLFGTGCSSMTSCVNDALDDALSDDGDLRDEFKDAINEMIGEATTLAGAYNHGVGDIDVAVSLDWLSHSDSENYLKTKWDVDFDRDVTVHSCAAGLTRASYFGTTEHGLSDDLQIQIPFRKLSDLFYEYAKGGELCGSFTWTSGLYVLSGQVKPAGSFRVSPVSDERIKLSLPVRIEASSSANVVTSMTGTLAITADVKPTCGGGGFRVKPVSVDLESLSGTIGYRLPTGAVVNMNVSTFSSTEKAAINTAIKNALLPELSLLPTSFDLGAAGKYASIGEVVMDSSSMTIGLNVASTDTNCP